MSLQSWTRTLLEIPLGRADYGLFLPKSPQTLGPGSQHVLPFLFRGILRSEADVRCKDFDTTEVHNSMLDSKQRRKCLSSLITKYYISNSVNSLSLVIQACGRFKTETTSLTQYKAHFLNLCIYQEKGNKLQDFITYPSSHYWKLGIKQNDIQYTEK